MSTKTQFDINKNFIDHFSGSVAIVDKNYVIVAANKAFTDIFGECVNTKANKIKPSEEPVFENVKLEYIFNGKHKHYSYKVSFKLKDKKNHFSVNLAALAETDEVEYAIILVNNISNANHWQKEFNVLFEKVPAYISIIDREHNILRANENFRDTFGDINGKHGYDAYHKKRQDIINCPSEFTFQDGDEYTSTVVGFTKSGEKTNLVVNSVPLASDEKGVSIAMEIAIDITEINQLQDQLHGAHDFYSSIIEDSVDGIIAITNKGKAQIINSEAKRILAWEGSRKPGLAKINEFMPKEFFREADESGKIIKDFETKLISENNEPVDVRFSAFEIRNKKKAMGRVAFFHDLSLVKSLERKQIQSEKTAFNYTFQSVGENLQKVINIQKKSFLEFDEAINTNRVQNIKEAWQQLKNKFSLRNEIAETFLGYAKGFDPEYTLVDPKEIIEEIKYSSYERLKQFNVQAEFDISDKIQKSYIDFEAFKACVYILIMNSILSCSLNDQILGSIKLFADQREGHLIVDIYDNHVSREHENDKIGFLTVNLIMDKLNGKLDISENKTIGTRNSIILPVISSL